MIIYLDESGDLGFDFETKHPSEKFVITLLVCNNSTVTRAFKKSITRTIKNKLNKGRKGGYSVHELKGTGTTINVKRYFYRHSPKTGWSLYAIVLNKRRVFDHLQTKQGKKKLYNYIARILIEQIDLREPGNAVTLIVDKCKNKDEIADFNQYIGNQLEALLPLDVPLNIYHEGSSANAGLQAVDLFCWGVFRKYEHGDREWYGVYRSHISYETEYLRQA
ncbi:MAG TPA: DUF3800 domain-containing protein [Gammaproteobacteria bacterium]|nr:DUF3800 domain-containing protein [Gammaproteobacteria bacterium]